MNTAERRFLAAHRALLLAALLAAGCGGETADRLPAGAERYPRRAPQQPTPTELESDRRMIEKLRGIYERTADENSFLGDRDLRELTAALAALPAEAPPALRWDIVSRLGVAELRLGRPQQAIEHLTQARELLSSLVGKITEKQANRSYLELGIAWLRLAETQNCVALHTAESCIFPIDGRGVHTDKRGSQKAYDAFLTTLRVFPDDLKARWLLNIAAMTLGIWPDGVPSDLRIGRERFESKREFPRFADVAPALEVNVFDLSGGSVVDDFDGDGLYDIVTSTWDTRGSMHYLKNNGDGSFSDRTAEAGLDDEFGGINMVQADYDNDGDLDLFVLRGAWLLQAGRHPESLLENDGTGHFTDVTFLAGLGEVEYPTHSGAFADFDLDGDLDIAIGHESRPESPFPSQLFKNNGDGTFTDVAAAAGTTNLRYAKGVTWGDYDGDRYPDLYVSNLFGDNRLYHNNRDGTFTDVAPALGMVAPSASFPTWWWDFDNDGALDLFVSSWEQDVSKYAASVLGLPHKAEPACLYKGDGRGGFKEIGREQGLTLLTQPMGANFGDLDNDGYPDFYLGTGYPDYESLMPNTMYLNLRGKGFADVTTAGGFGHLQKGHGISFADLDNDGDQDVYEQMGGAFPGDAFGNALYENPGFGNRWIKLELVGVESNRCAIGSRIRVVFQENGAERSIYKHVNSGGTFGSNPLRQELGLGKATKIDRIEIHWPKTDKTQVFTVVPLDAAYRVREGASELERVELSPFRFAR